MRLIKKSFSDKQAHRTTGTIELSLVDAVNLDWIANTWMNM